MTYGWTLKYPKYFAEHSEVYSSKMINKTVFVPMKFKIFVQNSEKPIQGNQPSSLWKSQRTKSSRILNFYWKLNKCNFLSMQYFIFVAKWLLGLRRTESIKLSDSTFLLPLILFSVKCEVDERIFETKWVL